MLKLRTPISPDVRVLANKLLSGSHNYSDKKFDSIRMQRFFVEYQQLGIDYFCVLIPNWDKHDPLGL